MNRMIVLATAAGLCLAPQIRAAVPATAGSQKADVVVIEGTPGGIATAVRAAREGLSVILVNRTQHLGGILSSGLGVWDTLHEGRRSPIYDEVRQAIFHHYRTTYGEDSPQYRAALPGKSGHTNGRFEPRVAEQILTGLVEREAKIAVLRGYVPLSAEREGAQIKAVTVQAFGSANPSAMRLEAAVFVDASYEGDLLPLVNAPYRVGREARGEFGEPHAGRIFMRPSAQPPSPEHAALAAVHDQLNLRRFSGFQEIVRPESTGEADGNVQAFNFRTILTSDPANRLPVEKPADYDPEFLKTLEFGSIVSPLPNHKIGWNRPQLIGPHQAYVEGDWQTRQTVMDQHWQAAMALLFFLQNDPSVTEERRAFFGRYGLARDEFADHGHRPYEIYVREARRLAGRKTVTQHDLMLADGRQRAPVHADGIAFAEWYMDAHACTAAKAGGSLDEGKMMLHHETFPGHVPYAALLPQEIDNLLVPVCLSATHVAWGAIRLEPAWMQIGEAAGLACALAVKQRRAPAEIDVAELQRGLVTRGSMISFFNDLDGGKGDPRAAAAWFFAAKGFFPSYDARLADPLNERTAAVWQDAADLLAVNAGDPRRVAARLDAVPPGDGPPILARHFQAGLLQTKSFRAPGIEEAIRRASIASGKPLTRGDACLILFHLLDPTADQP